MEKIKLGVIFGGKSVEHEISIISASQAINGLNKDKYEIIPIYISKEGEMYTGDALLLLDNFKDLNKLLKECIKITFVKDKHTVNIMKVSGIKSIINSIDVAFPIVHGTNCEDGTIAGLLNFLDLPYVGPDVLSSALGMDKEKQKAVLKEAGIPVVDYVSFYAVDYVKDEDSIIKKIEDNLHYPLIVKPGNLGSSVGITKVESKVELSNAIDLAMEFSDRIIVENAITNLKEINCAIIGDETSSEVSVLEEPYFSDEILSYTDKYVGDGKVKGGTITGTKVSTKLGEKSSNSSKKIPADVSRAKTEEIQNLTKDVFKTLGCSGFGRVDFLLDTKSDKVYVNEINTIPGALSYYLWEASGKSFTDVLDKAIDIAIKKYERRRNLTFSYDKNILSM